MGVNVSLEYRPRGREAFEGHLKAPEGMALTVSGTLADASPATRGDVPLSSNLALVTNLWAYAKHEAYRRRLRAEDKRKSHEKQAKEHRRACLAIAEMVSKRGDSSREGWCSACFAQTAHRRVHRFGGPAEVYLCDACGAPTSVCAGVRCKNMANRGIDKVTSPRYCAEHRHEIPSFEKLEATVDGVPDWEDWLKFEKRNLARATRVVGGVVLSAAVVTPAAWVAAPAIGGAVGGMTGLYGAAATSHGLAILGGGSVAAGGLGMAGGTSVVTAVGAGLGGVVGGTATSAYVSADKSFSVERLRDGTGAPVLVASGFLTEGEDGWGPWERLITERYPDRPVFRVHWGSKELRTLGSLAAVGVSSQAARKFAATAAAKAAKKGAGRAGWLGALLLAKGVASNPWMVAKTRAGMTGAVLADLIARTQEEQFVLVGHSLGARVMVIAAQLLGTRPGEPRLEDVHLLGAAVGNKGDWRTLHDSVGGSVWNYWSSNDLVLKYLYAATSAEHAAGQCGFATKFERVKNRNVSRQTRGHSAYFESIRLVKG